MWKDFSVQATTMGLLAAFAGFAGSFAVVFQGLIAVGASEVQAASGLTAAAVAMGLSGIILSLVSKMPVSAAWSTPGAALLVTTGAVAGGFSVAVGAFIVCAIGIIAAGLWRPLGRAIAAIPGPLANAMLAGILVTLCFAPFKAIAFDPLLGLPILLAWIIVAAFNRILAVPAALAAFAAVVYFGVDVPAEKLASLSSAPIMQLEWVAPEFTPAGFINIAVPLFIVTMASQNIPGIAVIKSYGYEPRPGQWFSITGLLSLIAAPFGSHAVNLAAITAAMCAGEEAHTDKDRRYWAAIMSGVGYVIFGLFAGIITTLVSLAPAILIQAVAGLALIGAFSKAVVDAFEESETREAAAVTFLVSASGISVLGISGAFWGLIAGGIIMLLKRVL